MVKEIEPFYFEVGRSIQARRRKQRITQEQLGELLNPPMTRVSIANIELGKQRILTHTFVELARILEVDVHDLLPQKNLLPSEKNLDIATELERKLGITKTEVRKLAKKLSTPTK